MTKLHEVLAAEKTVKDQNKILLENTEVKFKKSDSYFRGHTKTLKMIADSDENKAIEEAAREDKPVITNVYETLDYVFNFWAKNEDFQAQKNEANTRATSYLEFRGERLLENIPVDEILGLLDRLATLRGLLLSAPTIDSSRTWERGAVKYTWRATADDVGTKTEKRLTPVILSPATDKHPAQVEKVVNDVVIGKTAMRKSSGELTAQQKADLLAAIDELIAEGSRARSRCNEIEVDKKIVVGKVITGVLRSALLASGEYETGTPL